MTKRPLSKENFFPLSERGGGSASQKMSLDGQIGTVLLGYCDNRYCDNVLIKAERAIASVASVA